MDGKTSLLSSTSGAVSSGARLPRHSFELIGILAFAAALALFTATLQNDYWLQILFMCGVYHLCAVGMNMLVGYAGQKSLGQAGLFAAGAYTAALLNTQANWNPWLALVGAGVVSGGFGVLIALPSLRVKGPYLAMVTLAFGIVVEKIVAENTDWFGGAQGIYNIASPTWNGEPLSSKQWVWLVIILGSVAHLLLRNLARGRFGRSLLSLQADEIAAGSVGIRVYRAKVLVFVIAAVTCGVAGALVAQQNQYFNSDFVTFDLSIFILLLVLFGGAGSMGGPVLGAVTLTLVDALLARWPSAQHFIYGALLLFALFVMPGGVAGMFRRLPWLSRLAPNRSLPVTAASELPGPFVEAGEGDLLVVDHLSKAFGGVKTAQDVSFRLQYGHIHALIGPNGAGKSTMINMLTGIVRPNAGSIRFRGQDMMGVVPHAICHAGIGRTFQNLRLFAKLSVLDNVMLGCHSRMKNGFWASMLAAPNARREEAAARDRATALLAFLGLGVYATTPAGSLAYGLQRRVELARALATEPHLLLLDEPAAGLNPQETAELGDLLQRIAERGLTILMVEHHMDLVMKISDHVIVLDYGVKIAEGSPAIVQSNPAVIEAYLGKGSDDTGTAIAPLRHDDRVVLKLDSVRVSYDAIEAVKGVSIEVRAGEVVTIIGANGAGKSTLLRAIAGLEPLSSGNVYFEGRKIDSVGAHGRLGLGLALSPEGRGVFSDQTVLDNLRLGAYHIRAKTIEVANRVDREFQRFPLLRERANQLAGTLSGGEQQMLAISRALMSDPQVLLLDEPSLGLAPLITRDIFAAIRELRASGLTLLLVEQMANQALAVADRAYVLETGSIILQGSGSDLLINPQVRAAYLGAH